MARYRMKLFNCHTHMRYFSVVAKFRLITLRVHTSNSALVRIVLYMGVYKVNQNDKPLIDCSLAGVLFLRIMACLRICSYIIIWQGLSPLKNTSLRGWRGDHKTCTNDN